MVKMSAIHFLEGSLDWEPNDMEIQDISDGYHSFRELYQHRNTLVIALLVQFIDKPGYYPWRAKTHADGTMFDGYFIVGCDGLGNNKPPLDITYHLEIDPYWELSNELPTYEKAPEWDGHTPEDVVQRLQDFYIGI